jgi:hypothetical protein
MPNFLQVPTVSEANMPVTQYPEQVPTSLPGLTNIPTTPTNPTIPPPNIPVEAISAIPNQPIVNTSPMIITVKF